eukprot:1175520-Pyramimonas_sp.AAC.1
MASSGLNSDTRCLALRCPWSSALAGPCAGRVVPLPCSNALGWGALLCLGPPSHSSIRERVPLVAA